MQYCKRCIYPESHPHYLTFDDEGVCSGCRIHEEKDTLDWEEKFRLLEKVVGHYRNKDGDNYDCIVPVCGGRDSYFITHVVTKKLGLNPLLLTYNEQYNTRKGIRNLARLVTAFDCDHMQYTVNPQLIKKIVKVNLKKYGDIYWHCNAGMTVFPVQVAVRFNIPLIIWGAHPLTEAVGMFSHLDLVEMAKKVRKEHFIREFEGLVDEKEGITQADMTPFLYPTDEELENVGVRGLYLDNFIRWDAQKQHEDMIRLYGYESGEQDRTFNPYENVHCFVSAGVQDYLKFLKFGYGRASDHAVRDIRLKRMTREEAIELSVKYDRQKPHDLTWFLNWLGITEKELEYYMESHRDPRAWEKVNNEWRLKDPLENHINDPGINQVRLERTEVRNYIHTVSPESDDKDTHPYLMGRTYLDKRNFRAVTD
ncbi:MAG: N-acetyl sugar amidotransferase [Proteobacteria bacterium]|nr:N-acetyl sugar amidotransferase [Pseudomonadota bacterium]